VQKTEQIDIFVFPPKPEWIDPDDDISREVALKLVEQRDIITVTPMDKAHALALFGKKLGAQGDSKDIAELAAAVEFMPLAIVQAAAYIAQRALRCSVEQYIE
jgi:hypothetical protein